MELSSATTKSRIIIERDSRFHIKKYINVNRKVMIISDDGVPKDYVATIKTQCPCAFVHSIKQGEASKSLRVVEAICYEMYQLGFDKQDLLFAVGGGVVGDLTGYIASIYKLGIAFVSLPTTTLSQIDSSIGGKTAVNLDNVKNIIGAFYHPKVVLIDLNTLATLSHRQYYSGLVEALKVGLLRDPILFSLFEHNKVDFSCTLPPSDLEQIIERSLIVKRDIVEADEKESGLRKILNFGHTFGHAIESVYNLKGYTHGECVGIGMVMILKNEALREKVKMILHNMELPYEAKYDEKELYEFVTKDKKAEGATISLVLVDEVGKGYVKEVNMKDIRQYIGGAK